MPLVLLSAFLAAVAAVLAAARAECERHLPVVSVAGASPEPTPVEAIGGADRASRQRRSLPYDQYPSRVLAGLKPSESDYENIVVVESNHLGTDESHCVGSLIASQWVLTAAQCFSSPGSSVLVGGVTSTGGVPYGVVDAIPHPGWGIASGEIERDDIQLLKLDRPVFTPKPSPTPNDETEPVATEPPPAEVPLAPRQEEGEGEGEQGSPTPAPPLYNVMWLNTNPKFAQEPDTPRYLRIKGFGVRTRPNEGKEPLNGGERPLTFADLMTAGCDDDFGNDEGRRLCTKKDNKCGPCFGDTGAPLYDVDQSGKVSVLVGIVTFGLPGIDNLNGENVCTTGDRPTVYTAVAPYVSWIRETTGENLTEFFIPRKGITDTNLDPDENRLAIVARTSIIVIASLALVAFIGFLLVTCTLRRLRRRRKRWVEGLHAEESFVKGDEKDADIVDPFEGILDDQRTPRLSVNSLRESSRAAVKSATEFSARSIGTIRAMLMNLEDEEMRLEPREPMEDAPQWLPNAWENLFKAPSKKNLEQIHKVRTQRVVDDVLEGGDKSVEPSLDNVAFKNARDEANLEAAWKKLEIKTSLRNLSEASGSQDEQLSMSGTGLSTRGNSSRLLSRRSSRGGTHGALSSLLGGGVGDGTDIAKADTILAAFASIDAESEQVAEETVIDPSALHDLANNSRRPKVLETLRRKFSSSALSQATSNRSGDAEPTSPRVRRSSRKAVDGSVTASVGESSTAPVPAMRVGSGPTLTLAALANRSSKGFSRGFSGGTGSGNSAGELSPHLSRDGSMGVDYFSEDYSLSSSSDDDEPKVFEFESASRRFTEDRLDALGSERSLRGFRKGLTRSFEELEERSSAYGISFDGDDRASAAPVPEIDSVLAEGTTIDTAYVGGSGKRKALSMSTASSSRDTGRLATDENGPVAVNTDMLSISTAPSSRDTGRLATDGNGPVAVNTDLLSISTAPSSQDTGRLATDGDGPVAISTGVSSMRAEGSMGGGPRRLGISGPVRIASGSSDLGSEDGSMMEGPVGRVDGMSMISVAALKDMWNEMARRDSEESS